MKKVFSVLVSLVFCLFVSSSLKAQATVVHDGKTLKINCNNPTASVPVNVKLSAAGIPEGGPYSYVAAVDSSPDLTVVGAIFFNGEGGGFGSPPPSPANVSLSSQGSSICDSLAPGEMTTRSLTFAPTLDTLAGGNFIAFTVDIVICKDALDDDDDSKSQGDDDDDSDSEVDEDQAFVDNIEGVELTGLEMVDFTVGTEKPLVLDIIVKVKNIDPLTGLKLATGTSGLQDLTDAGARFIKAIDALGTPEIKLSRKGQLRESRRRKRQAVKDAQQQAKSEGKSKSEIKEAGQKAAEDYDSMGFGRVVKELDLKTLDVAKDDLKKINEDSSLNKKQKKAKAKALKKKIRANILGAIEIESGGTVTLTDDESQICVPVKITFDAKFCPVKSKTARLAFREALRTGDWKAILAPGESLTADYPLRFVGELQQFVGDTAKNGRKNGKFDLPITVENNEEISE